MFKYLNLKSSLGINHSLGSKLGLHRNKSTKSRCISTDDRRNLIVPTPDYVYRAPNQRCDWSEHLLQSNFICLLLKTKKPGLMSFLSGFRLFCRELLRNRTVWTQLAYHFNWRTAKPLGASPPPGYDEPTSRCRTPPSLWTLRRN